MKERDQKPGRSSSHLRCVKGDASYQWRAPTRWRLELGERDRISISVPRVTHTLYLFLSSSSEAFLGLFVLVPQSSVRPQLASPKCLPEVGHGRGEERRNTCLRRTFLPPRNLNPLGFLFMIPKGMPYYMSRRMGWGVGGWGWRGVGRLRHRSQPPPLPPLPRPIGVHLSSVNERPRAKS